MKKISSIAIACSLVLVVFSSALVCANTPETTPFSYGNGTLSDPYQITTIEELDEIRDYLDCCFILMNNLDFEDDASYANPEHKEMYITDEGWQPIGYYEEETAFTGSFDGQGYSISNLFVNRSLKFHSSLFGKIHTAEIAHLDLIDVYVVGLGNVGSVAGGSGGSTIVDCSASGMVIGSGFNVGGLVGWNTGSISDCNVSADVTGDFYVGGLVGLNKGVITDSSASGEVIGSDFNTEIRNIGGLVGGNLGSVIDSFATGNVTGNTYVGGLVGANWHNISLCYATGEVKGIWHNYGHIVYGRRYVGRLTGADFGNVSSSYATGGVTFRGYVLGVFYHLLTHLLPERFSLDGWDWWMNNWSVIY